MVGLFFLSVANMQKHNYPSASTDYYRMQRLYTQHMQDKTDVHTELAYLDSAHTYYQRMADMLELNHMPCLTEQGLARDYKSRADKVRPIALATPKKVKTAVPQVSADMLAALIKIAVPGMTKA